ncbi:MAG: putative bifunctional diguanylate cyclase/phosphodiesterase [Thermoleophilaceae bacterium]
MFTTIPHAGRAQDSARERRAGPAREPVPAAYGRFALGISAAAAAASAIALPRADWGGSWTGGRFWLLAACLLAGELLPIQLPHRGARDSVALSTAFAFALLLSTGVAPALVAYASAALIAGGVRRCTPSETIVRAAQYVLCLAGAGLTLDLLGHAAPVADVGDALPTIAVAAVVWLALQHALGGTAAALWSGAPVGRQLVQDMPFRISTAGFLLTLAPVVLVFADESLLLAPASLLPMLGIFYGGRQAAVNAHRALHDALTELPNRSLLRERLDSALAQARHEGLSVIVLMIDLDDFKSINDSLGHHYGDRLLVQVAARLSSAMREEDTLARLGGDEFAVVAEAVSDTAEADEIAERMLQALELPFELDTLSLEVRASIGVACYPEHGRYADELIQRADMALYRAKDSELPYELFGSDRDEGLDRLALATQLRQGIEREELVLDFQPKFPLPGGRAKGVEALVRWNHPRLGTIGPDGFIPLAEHTGLIKPLTDYVLRTALRQCAEWRAAGLDVRMSVNLSTRSLLDHELPAGIRSHLREHGLPPSALQLEIAENKIVTDLRRAQTVLEELRSMGIAMAIDDFGTGSSSLTQLQHLPVDEIKIDRSFVSNCQASVADHAIVRSAIALGRNLGIDVTAEGVESESLYRELRDLGCDLAQGFFMARPTGAEECARELGLDEREGNADEVVVPLPGAAGALDG